MPFKQNTPGCCCSCLIYEDTFNRANNASLGADWTVVQGSANITSNECRITAPDTIVINNVITGPKGHHIEIQGGTSGTGAFGGLHIGDSYRLIIGYVDIDNYFYLHNWYQGDTSERLQFWEVSGGTHTKLKESLQYFQQSYLNTCYTDSERWMGGQVNGGHISSEHQKGVPYWYDDAVMTGTGIGFGVGAMGGTHIGFDLFQSYIISPACDYCTNCYFWSLDNSFADPPRQVQVEISGMGDYSSVGNTCAACSTLDGTYVLDAREGCTWVYELPSAICTYDWLTATYTGSNNWTVQFSSDPFLADPFAASINWRTATQVFQPNHAKCGSFVGSGITQTVTVTPV